MNLVGLLEAALSSLSLLIGEGDDRSPRSRSLSQQRTGLTELDRLWHSLEPAANIRENPTHLRPVSFVKEKVRKTCRRPQL